jgi:outer membrane protein assembly factor BamE (lipoprotein component of BamABCDE complex)
MTNDETAQMKTERSMSRSVIRLARRSGAKAAHSSFVVFLSALAFALASTSCNNSRRITKANVDEVADGMAKKQVESILGPPTTVDTKDVALLKKTVYIYSQGKDTVTIVFKDDKVQSKASTLSD